MNKANEPAFPVSVAVGPAGDIYSSLDYKDAGGLTKFEYLAMKLFVNDYNSSDVFELINEKRKCAFHQSRRFFEELEELEERAS